MVVDEESRRVELAGLLHNWHGIPRFAPVDQPSAGATIELDPLEWRLLDLIDRLRPDRREAFVLTQLTGLSYAEAAEICRCPVGTIRSRVARARDHLVGLLQVTGPVGRADDDDVAVAVEPQR